MLERRQAGCMKCSQALGFISASWWLSRSVSRLRTSAPSPKAPSHHADRWRQHIQDNGDIKHAAHRQKFGCPLATTPTDASALRRHYERQIELQEPKISETAGYAFRQIHFEMMLFPSLIWVSIGRHLSCARPQNHKSPVSMSTVHYSLWHLTHSGLLKTKELTRYKTDFTVRLSWLI